MDIDDIFIKSYLTEFTEREKKKILLSQEDRLIAAEKKRQLEPIEKFLQKFVDLQIHVHHYDQYTKNSKTTDGIEPQEFNFYLVDSSKTWSPGVSIWFDHPAMVEIAIPNNQHEDGMVVIKVATHHPDAYILEQKFYDIESACRALARFLGKCTTSISKDPRDYLKEYQAKKQAANQDPSFLHHVPEQPPEDVVVSRKGQNIAHKEGKTLKTQDEQEKMSLKKIGEIFSFSKSKNQNDDEE